jgi:DUF971 family protein
MVVAIVIPNVFPKDDKSMTTQAPSQVPGYDSRLVVEPPSSIIVHAQSKQLELVFAGVSHRISFELMRVYSPSAEVQGHGPGQEVLQVGKRDVGIQALEPVGLYAVKPVFTDGHESGIFSWGYLQWLCTHQAGLWEDYLARLAAAGASRDPDPHAPPTPSASGCAGKAAAPKAPAAAGTQVKIETL